MEPTRVSTPQGGHTAAAQTARSKASAHAGTPAAPDQGGGVAGGFLSLLSALGGEEPALLPTDGAPPLFPDAGALAALLGAQVLGDAGGKLAPGDTLAPGATGASTLSLAPGAGSASTLSLSGAGALGGAGALTGAGALGAGTAGGVEVLPAGGLVAQTALLDNALDTPALEGGNTLAGYRRAFSRMQGALSQSLAATGTPALAVSHHAAAGDKPGATAGLGAAPAFHPMNERRDAGSTAAGLPRPVPAEPASSLGTPPLTTIALGPETPVLARSREEGWAPLGAGGETWGSASSGPESVPLTDSASFVAEPGQAGAEDALAEQVAYWVNENLQNAELTVTHDGKPVEVRVSLSGNEAHVVFGSDQSETRDLLDASVAQLRDLLHSEGLVLSGMTVGGSGARNAASDGGESARGRQSGRQAQVLVPAADVGATRPRVLTDRAVDVFV